jgi:hypothetical protein
MSTQMEGAPTGESKKRLDGHRVQQGAARGRYLYVAAPLDAREDSVYYPACLRLVEFALPGFDVVEGVREYDGLQDWQRRGPDLIRNAHRMVVVPREDGSIGAGVMREIIEASFSHVPVGFAAPGFLVPLEDVVFQFSAAGCCNHFAVVTMDCP